MAGEGGFAFEPGHLAASPTICCSQLRAARDFQQCGATQDSGADALG